MTDFMRTSKNVVINIVTNQGVIQISGSLYPEGIAVCKMQGVYYAVDALTGYAIYSMCNVYDLIATLRSPENRNSILEMQKKLRMKKPAKNKF